MVLTDGAYYIAEACDAYWLFDAVASYLGKYRSLGFAVARLVKSGATWTLIIEDGNDNVLAKQRIGYSDFPLDEVMLYVSQQEDLWVIMLTSEY